MPHQRVEVIESRVIYEGRRFGVRCDRVLEPGGAEVTREVVTHRGSVVLLPVFGDNKVLLVRQYRHAVGQYLWELVAGRIEPNEQPLAAAQRELAEETGYSAGHFRKLLEVFPSPGILTERMIIYLAQELTAGRARPEEDERIVAKRFALRELEQMIRRGSLRDAKSIAGILYYARFRSTRR